jgi:hypothetical protein
MHNTPAASWHAGYCPIDPLGRGAPRVLRVPCSGCARVNLPDCGVMQPSARSSPITQPNGAFRSTEPSAVEVRWNGVARTTGPDRSGVPSVDRLNPACQCRRATSPVTCSGRDAARPSLDAVLRPRRGGKTHAARPGSASALTAIPATNASWSAAPAVRPDRWASPRGCARASVVSTAADRRAPAEAVNECPQSGSAVGNTLSGPAWTACVWACAVLR